MKTDVIRVSSKGNQIEKALGQIEKIAAYKELTPKNTLHLRLLTEEMMGMMRSITGETEGEFWVEDQDGEYQLHLRVRTRLNADEREQLLAASSSGRNELAKGLMGRIRDFFDWGSDEYLGTMTSSLMLPDIYEHSSSPALDMEWSMVRYESALSGRIAQNDAAAKEAWDELEKSVVKHVADDVKVSIRNGVVEMTILKKLA